MFVADFFVLFLYNSLTILSKIFASFIISGALLLRTRRPARTTTVGLLNRRLSIFLIGTEQREVAERDLRDNWLYFFHGTYIGIY